MGEGTFRTGEDKQMEVTMGGGKTRTDEVIEGGMVIEEAGSTIRAATIGTTKEVLKLIKGEVALKAETYLGWSLLSYEFSNRISHINSQIESMIHPLL